MAKGKYKDKDWSKDRAGAFEFVFLTHRWGDAANAGKSSSGGYYAAQQAKGRRVPKR